MSRKCHRRHWVIGSVFWFAVLACQKQYKEPQAIKAARDLGKASFVTSIAGIIVAAFIVFMVLVILVSRQLAKFNIIEFLLHNV